MDVPTGDIEVQLHHPKWFIDHKHMLRPNQEGEVNDLGYFILKVSQIQRQPPQAFSPREWRFGLHNQENFDNNGSEAVKLGIAVLFGLVGEEWDCFCNAIVDDPKAMLVCYGLHDGVSTWTNEQIKHVLALDALFLATYIDLDFPNDESQVWKHNCIKFDASNVLWARWKTLVRTVYCDLYQVENQIPFVLIDKVVEFMNKSVASQTSKVSECVIIDLQYQLKSLEYVAKVTIQAFMGTLDEAFKIDNSYLLDKKMHILGVVYKIICEHESVILKRKWRSVYIHVPSASKLKQSSIKIVGINGPLCTMFYKKNYLYLPRMKLYDYTSSFIRNMAWYEENNIEDGCLFHDYIILIKDLIQAPEDLDLLIQNGVIDNHCGIKGFEMWKTLDEGLIHVSSSKTHHKMKGTLVELRNYQVGISIVFLRFVPREKIQIGLFRNSKSKTKAKSTIKGLQIELLTT